MARIKHTKTELKAQREALTRYERYLPMLQLKKQQLQSELHTAEIGVAEKEREEKQLANSMESWVRLFAEPVAIEGLVQLRDVQTETGNIAGVAIPELRAVDVARAEVDLLSTPPWVDDAVEALDRRIRLRVEREILEQQRERIAEELRITAQRVNLFEKVKIPECREHIRVIKIFLGDEQTAAVARAKLAKSRAA
ncbi:MAG: V-type ATP synthase subunit D [Lentisphaerae bacterium]|nr:V-type ATP synthase subunit D [Lentisphaerota bacterium]